jgi:hypothetical protein
MCPHPIATPAFITTEQAQFTQILCVYDPTQEVCSVFKHFNFENVNILNALDKMIFSQNRV